MIIKLELGCLLLDVDTNLNLKFSLPPTCYWESAGERQLRSVAMPSRQL